MGPCWALDWRSCARCEWDLDGLSIGVLALECGLLEQAERCIAVVDNGEEYAQKAEQHVSVTP